MNVFMLVIGLVASFRICAGQQCNDKGMRQFDANMARLLTIGNSGRKFPVSKGAPLKMEVYKTKCFKDLAKQVFGVLVYAVRNAMRQYCRKDSKKLTDLIAAVPCVTKNDPVVTKCYTNYIDGVLGAKNAVDTKKLPHMCWYFIVCSFILKELDLDNILNRYFRCIFRIMNFSNIFSEYTRLFQCFSYKLTKAPSCNEKNVESISDLVRTIVGNVIDLICGDYVEGSDKCDSLGNLYGFL